MKYIVLVDISTEVGEKMEANPAAIQEMIAKWQAEKPIGMYGSLTRRRLTIILDAANEDDFFEALHATWVATESYPEVWPVVDMEEFRGIMQRLGMTS
jgi:hypothetical protein